MNKLKYHNAQYKHALARVIAPLAFWSYAPVHPEGISNDRLIEAVLLHGNDALKLRLFSIFSKAEVRQVWEERLVIQGDRLHDLNYKIAVDFLGLCDPERSIQEAYQKHNLYDRFSA